MATSKPKIRQHKKPIVSNAVQDPQHNTKSALNATDHRPAAIAQRKLQEAANNSLQVKQLESIQAMADDHSSKTAQYKTGSEEGAETDHLILLQRKVNSSSALGQPVIQKMNDPDNLERGREFALYQKIKPSAKLIKDRYEDDYNKLVTKARDMAHFTTLVGDFWTKKDKEIKAAEAAKKVAAAEELELAAEKLRLAEEAERTERERLAAIQAEAEARATAEAERIAREEALRLAAIAAAEEAERQAAAEQAAEEQAEIDAEGARLLALYVPNTHKLLTLADIESFADFGYQIVAGKEYDNVTGGTTRKTGDTRVRHYGIFIKIRPKGSRNAFMTGHFHAHDGRDYKNPWNAHFKVGMDKKENMGHFVTEEESLRLFTAIKFRP